LFQWPDKGGQLRRATFFANTAPLLSTDSPGLASRISECLDLTPHSSILHCSITLVCDACSLSFVESELKNRALIIGVSNYSSGITSLPAVARDVQEIAKLLGSADGSFKDGEVRVFTDADVKRESIIRALRDVFENAQASDTIFAYVAGHGLLDADKNFYFIPHDIEPTDIAGTAIPLRDIKSMFDRSRSERVLLWLDFCHSGGILARDLETQGISEVSTVVERTLRITQGRGKVIMCACTADQKAYESGEHGHFTKYLLEGLK
jgi:hypothetical protein